MAEVTRTRVVRRRIRGPGEIQEREIKIDSEDVKNYPELDISVLETCAFDKVELQEEVRVKFNRKRPARIWYEPSRNAYVFLRRKILLMDSLAEQLPSRDIKMTCVMYTKLKRIFSRSIEALPIGASIKIEPFRPKYILLNDPMSEKYMFKPIDRISLSMKEDFKLSYFIGPSILVRPLLEDDYVNILRPKRSAVNFKSIYIEGSISVKLQPRRRSSLFNHALSIYNPSPLRVSGPKAELIAYKNVADKLFSRVDINMSKDLERRALERAATSLGLTVMLTKRGLEDLGISARYIGEPIIIILPSSRAGVDSGYYDYHYAILEICKEIYRESRGGLPKPYVFIREDQLENFVAMGERFSDKIAIIDLEEMSPLQIEEIVKKYRHTFRELFSQGLGFIVFILPEKVEEDLADLIRRYSSPYRPKIIDLSYIKVDRESAKGFQEFIRTVWGLDIETDIEPIAYAPSEMLSQAERTYKDTLDTLLRLRQYVQAVRRGENESEDHLALKILAIKHLVETENINVNMIESEKPIRGLDIIPDLYLGSRGLAVEIETLYGIGTAPLLKIRDSVLKYKDIFDVKEIWIVLRNLPLAIYFDELYTLREELAKTIGKKIEFYTPDLSRLRLKSFSELLQQLIPLARNITPIDLLK